MKILKLYRLNHVTFDFAYRSASRQDDIPHNTASSHSCSRFNQAVRRYFHRHF